MAEDVPQTDVGHREGRVLALVLAAGEPGIVGVRLDGYKEPLALRTDAHGVRLDGEAADAAALFAWLTAPGRRCRVWLCPDPWTGVAATHAEFTTEAE
jgi:hypothetical protein